MSFLSAFVNIISSLKRLDCYVIWLIVVTAYMAPEVFMKNESIGHGRAVDIWSVGCCVIEMASGKMPWSEFDSYYQIMFKVCHGR